MDEKQLKVPSPNEIRQRIEKRQAEIAALRRVLRLAAATATAHHLSLINDAAHPDDRQGVTHAS